MQYFDHNATAPLRPEARAAWIEAQDESWLNPSSPYRAAARVRARYEEARIQFAEMLGIRNADLVVFNSGATEGNNQVFQCLARQHGVEAVRMRVLLSAVEHASVLEGARQFWPGKVELVAVDEAGRVSTEVLSEALKCGDKVALVSMMAANNETGVLQDWEGLRSVCQEAGIPFHTDASQWVGRLPAQGLGACDWVTGCAHKFGGARGVGFIKVLGDGQLHFGQVGGGQESGRRGGTEDVASVLASLAALRAALSDEGGQTLRSSWRDEFEAALEVSLPEIKIIGRVADRLWNTSCLVMPRWRQSRWIAGLERRGFLVSTGSACAGNTGTGSRVMEALGLGSSESERVLRISSGALTSEEDWRKLLRAMQQVFADLEGAAGSASGEGSQVVRIPD